MADFDHYFYCPCCLSKLFHAKNYETEQILFYCSNSRCGEGPFFYCIQCGELEYVDQEELLLSHDFEGALILVGGEN